MGEVVKMDKSSKKEKEQVKQECSCKAPENQKLSYEQLASAAHQLSEQGRQLYMRNRELEKQLEEADLHNLYKKLDYLWGVIHSDSHYLSEEFKKACAEEFEKLLRGNNNTPEEITNTKEEGE